MDLIGRIPLEAMLLLPVLGGGDMELKRSFMLWPWVPDWGFGAANWVEEVVVVLDIGAGIENAFDDTGAGAEGADWKSSKSSSSSAGAGADRAPNAEDAGSLEVVVVVIGSSPKSNRSTSGSFGFGASTFFPCRFEVGDDGP